MVYGANHRAGQLGETGPSQQCAQFVPWICTVCSLNVPRMFPECSLNVPWIFPDAEEIGPRRPLGHHNRSYIVCTSIHTLTILHTRQHSKALTVPSDNTQPEYVCKNVIDFMLLCKPYHLLRSFTICCHAETDSPMVHDVRQLGAFLVVFYEQDPDEILQLWAW